VFLSGPCWDVISKGQSHLLGRRIPCEGGVEYLHSSPASRRRRRKGKSRIWDSKIWSRVPGDSDPRMTALARTSSNCKRQTRPLARESTSYQQARNCLTAINLVVSPRWVLYSQTYWPTDRRSYYKTRTRLVRQFCTRGCEDRTWACEAEESPVLEAVVTKRLVKRQQAGKLLSGCCGDLWIADISGGAVIVCSSGSCKLSKNPFINPSPVYSHTHIHVTI
jgi:hypothetical protein